VSDSPLESLLGALDKLDLDGVLELMAPDCELLTVDGRRADGADAVRELLGDFVAALRTTAHRVTAQWQQDDVWFAEVEADYELQDWTQIKALPRAFVLRTGPQGISSLHAYGAHERAMGEHAAHLRDDVRIGGRWIAPM
jgi:hypothetical protein